MEYLKLSGYWFLEENAYPKPRKTKDILANNSPHITKLPTWWDQKVIWNFCQWGQKSQQLCWVCQFNSKIVFTPIAQKLVLVLGNWLFPQPGPYVGAAEGYIVELLKISYFCDNATLCCTLMRQMHIVWIILKVCPLLTLKISVWFMHPIKNHCIFAKDALLNLTNFLMLLGHDSILDQFTWTCIKR